MSRLETSVIPKFMEEQGVMDVWRGYQPMDKEYTTVLVTHLFVTTLILELIMLLLIMNNLRHLRSLCHSLKINFK